MIFAFDVKLPVGQIIKSGDYNIVSLTLPDHTIVHDFTFRVMREATHDEWMEYCRENNSDVDVERNARFAKAIGRVHCYEIHAD